MRAGPAKSIGKLLDVLDVAFYDFLILARFARELFSRRRGWSFGNLIVSHLRQELIVKLSSWVVCNDVVLAATVVHVVNWASQMAFRSLEDLLPCFAGERARGELTCVVLSRYRAGLHWARLADSVENNGVLCLPSNVHL